MPNIFVKVPFGSFSVEQRRALMTRLNDVAATNERMPNDPRKRFLTWIAIEEVAPGMVTCGGVDVTGQALPCIAEVHVPAGVLDAAARASYVADVHAAFRFALSSEERRLLTTSVILHEVPDGHWGANGTLWRLADFAKAAGYAHLQQLID
jgi:phenylpyruvate tautomerase PptA (4-oxalocrotonate tautomerase family)